MTKLKSLTPVVVVASLSSLYLFAVLAPLLNEQPRRYILSRHHTAAAAEAAARRHAGTEAVCLDDEGDVTASVQECREAGTL